MTSHLKALSIKMEAATGIELKCGGSSIVITPAAIFIAGGPLVMINSGSGPPVTPVTTPAVSPLAPKEAEDADNADPGDMADVKARQLQTKAGKYGSTRVQAHKPDPDKPSWIEIQLVDEEDNPVAGERYRVTLPDGETVAEGALDENGLARVEGIDPGICQITFPDLDQDHTERI